MDKVTGKHRPRAFLATLLVAGVPLTLVVGALLTGVSKLKGVDPDLLPEDLILPLAVVLGYSLSVGLAALVWGTPRRWRRYDDYKPGLTPRARMGASGAAGLAILLAVVVGFGLAGIDIFWGLVLGLLLGLAASLVLSGLHKRIAARRGQETLVPDMPERVKSLVLFTTWFVLFLFLFSVLTYALPGIVAWNAVASFVAGLAVAFLLVEEGLLRDRLARRKREKAKRKAWEARRREALARGTIEDDGTKPV